VKTKGIEFDLAFDVVVVGAGSAGCVVAGRVSESRDAEVCLIEAGDRDRNPWFHIPMGFGKTIMNPNYTWGYKTEPDPGIGDRSLAWVRGRVLGGSGSINGLVFLRGAVEDYDEWERLGAKGWSYRDVLPYFRKMESTATGADEHHGRDGPITVTKNRKPSETATAFVASCANLQFALNEDFNSGRLDGAGTVPINVNGRWRHSTASAYIKPHLRRPNLTLLTRTTVERILFEGKRAVGVEAISNGRRVRIEARREVVLSGGAINSPTLLLTSGVGPAHELGALSIDVVQHLPGVGKNLQDHLNVGLVYRTSVTDSVNLALTSRWRSAKLMANWFFTKSGPIAGGAVEAVLFAKTDPALSVPDVHFHLMNFSRDLATGQPHRTAGCTLLFNVCKPRSRGEVRLKFSGRLEAQITPRYLSDPDDMSKMIAAYEIACRLAATDPFRSLVVERIRPSAAALDRGEIERFIRASANTTYHPCGTCRMGEDEASVVDSRLRVRGMESLRIVDASIMPSIPSPNIHPATIMIAEKASDLIRGREPGWRETA
jgi:choline dehydrogenase